MRPTRVTEILFKSGEGSEAVELVSAAGHEVKRHWTFQGLQVSLMANKGNAVCGLFWPDPQRQTGLACWDAGTGARIAEDSKVQPGMYVGGLQSTGGELVAMIDSKWHVHDNAIWRFLDMQGG
jgi:hypothetical protein